METNSHQCKRLAMGIVNIGKKPSSSFLTTVVHVFYRLRILRRAKEIHVKKHPKHIEYQKKHNQFGPLEIKKSKQGQLKAAIAEQ